MPRFQNLVLLPKLSFLFVCLFVCLFGFFFFVSDQSDF